MSDLTITTVPAVRIVVAGPAGFENYSRLSGAAYIRAVAHLGTDDLNLCDVSQTPDGKAFTYTVRRRG